MPLRSIDKSAHHRQRVNSDPKSRAEYLAKRKERYANYVKNNYEDIIVQVPVLSYSFLAILSYCFSYQRRKQLGKIKYVKSSDLPKTERTIQRAQWRAASRNYRERKKKMTFYDMLERA